MNKYTCTMTALLLCLPAALLSVSVGASNPVSVDTRVDGGINPEAIPEWYKTRELFKSYRGELDNQLDRGEKIAVLNYVKEIAWLQGVHLALSTPQMHFSICPMVDSRASAEEIAAKIDVLEGKNELQFKQIHERFREKVGDAGKAKVLGYIDAKLTPKLVYERRSRVHLAVDDPELYISNWKKFCSKPFKGELSIMEKHHGNGSRTITKSIQ